MKTEDDDLTRAESFLTLQSEQGTRESLVRKQNDVNYVAERLELTISIRSPK